MCSEEKDFLLSERVWVYGTLRPGGSNSWRMGSAQHLGQASVRGVLYRLGWYPGLVRDASGRPVIGDLFQLKSAAQLAELDVYEGDEYQRVLLQINGQATWLWEYIGETNPQWEIEGDWLRFYQDRR